MHLTSWRTTGALLAAACLLPAAAHATTVVDDTSLPQLPAAMALTSDGLVVVGQRARGDSLAISRVRPGGGATDAIAVTEQVTGEVGFVSDVRLAASDGAIAAAGVRGLLDREGASSSAYIGPPGGPLRAVATCRFSTSSSPVAVDGTRVAYVEGGCARRSALDATPSTIVIASADPAAPAQRIPLPAGSEVRSLSLSPAGDRVVLQVDRFPDPDKLQLLPALHALTPEGLGPVLSRDRRLEGTLGVRADGTTVVAQQTDEAFTCTTTLGLLAAGRLEPLPGVDCLATGEPSDATQAGDRVLVLTQPDAVPSGPGPGDPRRTLLSVPGDGGAAAPLLALRGRLPRSVSGDAARIAYVVPPCSSQEPRARLVVTDEPQPPLAGCDVEVLSTRLTLRGGRADLRLRCPLGCRLSVAADRGDAIILRGRRRLAPGTGSVQLVLPAALRRRSALTLLVQAEDGPTRRARLPLRQARVAPR